MQQDLTYCLEKESLQDNTIYCFDVGEATFQMSFKLVTAEKNLLMIVELLDIHLQY